MSNWRTIVRNPKNLGAINLRGGGIAKRGTGQALKSGGRAALRFGSGRTNLLEELGRVEGEHSNRNRRAEISRVHSELNKGYKDGGRIGFKHGKYVKIPTPHADISKYVTKRGKVEGPEGEGSYWRRKDSTMKVPEKKKHGPGQRAASQRSLERKAEGGRIGLKKGTDKKWMQKVSASIKKRGTKGKCTPITKPGCTGRAKALAKTFKKIAAKRKA